MATTRIFSSRYVLMYAPAIAPFGWKCSRIILPKRLELLLRTVLALPKASSSGDEAMIIAASFPASAALDASACSLHHAM